MLLFHTDVIWPQNSQLLKKKKFSRGENYLKKVSVNRINDIFFTFCWACTLIWYIFFTKLMHKFFILIYLLHTSTCFDHYYAHLQEDNCISTAPGFVTLETLNCFQSDDTRCCTNTNVLLKMSIIMLETCRRI